MRRPAYLPWVIVTASLLLTTAATLLVLGSSYERDRDRFTNAVQATRDRIEARIETYAALLRGGAGLFAADGGTVSRSDFRAYTDRLGLEQRYRGIQGVGFTLRYDRESEDSLVAAMRAQGFPDFRPWPDTVSPEQHAILYLEPLDRRNQAAIGFNMFSEPTRRAAMERARDTGTPAVSGKVTLVQEIDVRKQAGFLMYVPVYRGGGIPSTVAERRARLDGFVYAPFRADDLFARIFGREQRPRAAFRIYDGPAADPDNLLHDSQTEGIVPIGRPAFTDTATFEVGERVWTLTFATTPYFSTGSRRPLALFIALAGLALSLVLFWLSRGQVRAQAASVESERRLRGVLESLPVGVFVADASGRITFSNATSRRIWAGGEHVALDQYGTYKGWWGDSGRRVESEEWGLARALRGETVEGELIDIEAFDGTRRSILNAAFPLRTPDGRVEMAVAAVVDVTDRRQAEAALRERERELRTMVDAIPQLAWMADETGAIFWYNRRWYEYTGTTLEEMQGWGWQKVHQPDQVERVTAGYRRAIEAEEPWEDTFPLRGSDGEYRWFLSRATPLRDEAGRVARWFGTNTDITEQIQARQAEARAIREQAARTAAEAREDQLRLQTAELERSNRELQEFAYVASHDLQEPLRKITSFADLLKSEYGGRIDDQATHYLDRMQHAAVRMSRLISDLLAFSRVQSRGLPFQPVDLEQIVSGVLADLEMRIEETDGQVEVGGLPTVDADPVQMRQLFQNLVGNALKFHKPEVPPVVRIACSVTEVANPFSLGLRDVCQLEVQDNGIGFDEKYLDRIFSPFQRLHGKDAYEGTGIGLAICRRIVERHGGTITARSTPGEGATFVVNLPLRHRQPEDRVNGDADVWKSGGVEEWKDEEARG